MSADDFYSSLRMNDSYADELRALDLIIWDEISMVPRWALQAADQLFRDLMGMPDLPFGGKTFVVGGDFRQVLPVIRGGTKCDVLNAVAKNFPHWRSFCKFTLTINQRSIDQDFRDFLLR